MSIVIPEITVDLKDIAEVQIVSANSSSTASVMSDSSSGACSEDTTTCSSAPSPLRDLPPSAYDGSHLHWKTFRQHVLLPHRIRIIEGPPKEKLPETLLAFIEAQSKNIERFDDQKTLFRTQLGQGRGFGPSPLFPPNLLPSIENEPQLARCMIPTFGRDGLPERALNQSGPLYELAVPRPGLGCGFGAFAFSNEEMAALPPALVVSGTSVDFGTGFISPCAAIYCPFLTFERTFGSKEHRMEAANNRCAIDGAWCCRALQTFYEKAHKGGRNPPTPVSFSCSIDNEHAVINYHWIDHAQAYHMSPLCRFDLGKDEHYMHFQAWIDAIGQWALTSLLPQIRDSVTEFRKQDASLLSPPHLRTPDKLTLTTGANKNDQLIKSLKTTFDNIPWKFEDDEFTPVSSSTASWGSPMVDDILFSNLGFATTKAPPRLAITNDGAPLTPKASLADQRMSVSTVPPNARLDAGQSPPPPAYTTNPELVWQRRFNHAMDEIQDLQAQVLVLKQGLSGSSTSFRRELSGLRNTLGSVLRKETIQSRNRSLPAGTQNLLLQANTEGQSPVAQPGQHPQRHPKAEPPPRLQLPGSKSSTNPRSRLHKVSLPPTSPTVTLSMNGVDLVLSPKEISTTLDLPTPPSTAFPRSPLPKSPLAHFWGPDTPVSIKSTPPTPGPSAGSTVPGLWASRFSPTTHSTWRWVGVLASGWALGALLPSGALSMMVLGCATSTLLQAVASFFGLNIAAIVLPAWPGGNQSALEQMSESLKTPLGIS